MPQPMRLWPTLLVQAMAGTTRTTRLRSLESVRMKHSARMLLLAKRSMVSAAQRRPLASVGSGDMSHNPRLPQFSPPKFFELAQPVHAPPSHGPNCPSAHLQSPLKHTVNCQT